MSSATGEASHTPEAELVAENTGKGLPGLTLLESGSYVAPRLEAV
jgi:hypothetical protein